MGSSGLHNTLEAAVFGLPIVIGKNYHKFPEAKEMLNLGGLFSVENKKTLEKALNKLIDDKDFRTNCGKKNKAYIDDNNGATTLILDELMLLLKD